MIQVSKLNQIGIALSAENNEELLMEKILSSARELTGADAGSLYMVNESNQQPTSLSFTQVQNDTLNVHFGGSGQKVDNAVFPDIPLRVDGVPNNRMVVAYSVLNEETVNIEDAYNEAGFDFSGTRTFDDSTGYRSTSILVVPLKNHEGDIIAALQLLNKTTADGKTVSFDHHDEELTESLASQAAVALTNCQLVADLHTLFESFTQVIASAIDSKSPQTGAHCRRVPDATLMLAEAANGSQYPGLEDFQMSEADLYELKIAAWMHDCGKVVTPPHVVEKSTKLETIHDRISSVEARMEVLARDAEIAQLKQQLKDNGQTPNEFDRSTFKEELEFLQACNKGGEFMADDKIAQVQQLANRSYQTLTGTQQPLLNDDEQQNLSIRKGTLSDEERKIMQDHMVHTINMLEQLPFPKHLRRVPEYAGGHHERMDGKGYPKGLTREQMSIPARIMGIADVFEALTAPERSYKKPMSLSQTLTIMGRMVEDNHLDPDLFRLFIDEKVYMTYANKHLDPRQIDEIDLDNLPGYQAH